MRALNLTVMAIFALILSYFLPIFANLFLPERAVFERVRYSPVIEDFMLVSDDKDSKTRKYEIIGGGEISEDEFIANQPFVNYSVLIPKGKFPSKFAEFAANPRLIAQNSQGLNLRPASNKAKYIPLYPVLDINPKFGRVIYTSLLFRLGDASGVQIVDMDKNGIDREISADLNSKFSQTGFKFPAKAHFSNPSVMKEFDEGAFIVDSEDKIFHLKFNDGSFSVKNTGLTKSGIINIVVSENARREFYALIVTDGELGLISYDDYKFIPLPNDGYKPFETTLNFRVTPVFKSVMFSDRKQIKTEVMDLNYNVLKKNDYELTPPSNLRYIKSYILPFETSIAQPSHYYKFKFDNFSAKSLCLSLILAFAFFAFNFKIYKRKPLLEVALIAVFGIYGFIAAILYYKGKR